MNKGDSFGKGNRENTDVEQPAVKEVQVWLKEIYKDVEYDVPDLEKEDKNVIEYLKRIMIANKKADEESEELTRAQKSLADKYKKKGKDLMEIVKKSNADFNFLPKELDEKFEEIAQLADVLDVEEPNLTNFLLSLSTLKNEERANEEELGVREYESTVIQKKLEKICAKNLQLKRDIEIEENIVAEQEPQLATIQQQLNFLPKKSEEYNVALISLKKQCKAAEYGPTLTHVELVKENEMLKSLQKELKDISAQLAYYKDLPPNESLALERIEQSRLELKSVEDEFERLMTECMREESDSE